MDFPYKTEHFTKRTVWKCKDELKILTSSTVIGKTMRLKINNRTLKLNTMLHDT